MKKPGKRPPALPAAVKVVDCHNHPRARHVLGEARRRIPELQHMYAKEAPG